MSVLDIILYPDRKLKTKSKPVREVDEEIRKLLDDMTETMYEAPGVGLAAPQVGRNIRAIVVDTTNSTTEEEQGSGLLHLINPEVIESSGEQIGEEGCLSIPGFVANVKRKKYLKIAALNREGNRITIESADLLARVLQHEMDHLDGILFFERLAKLKKDLLLKKINKAFERV